MGAILRFNFMGFWADSSEAFWCCYEPSHPQHQTHIQYIDIVDRWITVDVQ
jgi:hypothetical protein